MEAYSLYELNEYIKRVIALNFNESVWIKAEISQIKEARGQVYIDLVEKDEKSDQIIAQSSAIIWFKSYLFIKKKLGELADAILQDGTEVSIKVSIAFHERYGLKLNVEDIDPSYTLGQLELNRQKIIQRLKKDGLVELNQQLDLSLAFERVAIIASETSAGYKDFVAQLAENPYGYHFNTELYHVAVQGRAVSGEITAALQEINKKNFDLVVIIRGGGSKIDLSGFDDYNIGAAIAKCKFPVITGIGHEIDNTVADIISHTSLKTPTAVADFVIEHNLTFESEIIHLAQQVSTLANQVLLERKFELEQIEQLLFMLPNDILKSAKNNLEGIQEQLRMSYAYKSQSFSKEIMAAEQMLKSLNPSNILKRGFSLIKKGDKYIHSIKELKKSDEVEISLSDGTKKAIINE